MDSFPHLANLHTEGRYEIAEQLLQAGASVDFCDALGRTPLMFAAAQNNRNICHLLLTRGSNIHVTDSGHYKQTALHYAVQERKLEAAMVLVEHGAIVFDSSKSFHESPIFATVMYSPIVLHSFLIHCSTNIHSKMSTLLSYLFHLALREKQEGSAIIVLQNGYYPVQDVTLCRRSYKRYTSCFHLAASYGMVELMNVLIELNSQFMQENWLVGENIPAELAQLPDFASWLVEKDIPAELAQLPEFASYLVESRKQPSLLVKLCKSTILKRLNTFHKTYYLSKITDLPLPKSLKTFLGTVAMPTKKMAITSSHQVNGG